MPYKRKELLESKVYDYLLNHLLKDQLLDRFADTIVKTLDIYQQESSADSLEQELRDINKKISNINQAIAEGIWTKQTGDMLNELTAR